MDGQCEKGEASICNRAREKLNDGHEVLASDHAARVQYAVVMRSSSSSSRTIELSPPNKDIL